MFRLLAATASLAFLLSPAAFAQSISADASRATESRLVKSVTIEDLKAIAVAEGHTIVEVGGVTGKNSLIAKTKEGLFFVIVGQVCEETGVEGCLGIDFQVRYDADDKVTLQNVNKANLTYSFATVAVGNNESNVSTVYVSHYVILDKGQTMGNLRTALLNLLQVGPLVAKEIWPPAAK